MLDRYLPDEFESKWRARWQDADLFLTQEIEGRPKFYALDFFPYPSGAGLSVGHCRNYIPTDAIARMKRMQGYNVLHPMGFDAFGLPAENEAIKRKRHPAGMIDDYAANYRRQMDLVGIGYDWSRTFKSSDPDYYRWTQWIFKLLFDRGLAERRMATVNWDPVEKTVLADEEIIGGRAERSGALVEKKEIPQWFFCITKYAQRLLDDLDTIDWPEGIKQMQRNWIGRSEGVEFSLDVVIQGEDLANPAHAVEDLRASFPDLERAQDQALESIRAAKTCLETLNATEALARCKTLLVLAGSPIFEPAAFASDELATLRTIAEGPQRRADAIEDLLEDLIDEVAQFKGEAATVRAALMHLETAGDNFDTIEDAFEDFIDATEEPDELTVRAKPMSFRAFTTRIDTIYGVTFCVLAPEHPLVKTIAKRVRPRHRAVIAQYQKQARELSETDRTAVDRPKTGAFTGAYAVNPATGKHVPLYLADYVLMNYGTGGIMAVPGHDERDFEFAQKYDLPVVPVIAPEIDSIPELPYAATDGYLINSGSHTGLKVEEAKARLADWMEAEGIGERKVNFKMRDWLISRQRYWGCPIPVVYNSEGGMELVPEDQLPVTLPDVEHYEPGDDGSSPLAGIPEFVNTTTKDGTLGQRETDTMGGFACSSWYFLRFCDPFNQDQAWDPEKVAKWMPVDCYVGGAEHAVMHLLYARFWTKVLYDAGLVPVNEPFERLINQGQVLGRTPYRQPREGERLEVGEDGILISYDEAAKLPESDVTWKWVRMSKSKGNIVTPDEAVAEYGADALRVFELFVAPFEQNVQWSNEGMQGSVRFLSRVMKWGAELSSIYQPDWALMIDQHDATDLSRQIRRATHQMVAKCGHDIERFAFNTYISAMMTALNKYGDLMPKDANSLTEAEQAAWSEALSAFIRVLAPAAPHTADEMWSGLGYEEFTLNESWPAAIEALAAEDEVTVAVQVNGKLRDTITLPAGLGNEELEQHALASEKVKAHLDGKTVRKVIVIPGKLVNVVAN